MRASELFVRTLREAPAEAEAPSHKLLVRAGYIRKIMAGVYALLPLGIRTLQRVQRIVEEEMNAAGAQEVRLPAVLPSEPWKQSGRWAAYGDEMFRLKDRSGRDLSLGPTHEEFFAEIVKGEFSSYRDLPVNLYQVQWKYRDELRPRGGVIRAREFLMKDAYTFDRDVDGLRVAYQNMVEAYKKVFTRCGLTFRMVEADPGLIGGDVNHEFMAPADVGEDLFVFCPNCDYAANVEAASTRRPEESPQDDPEALQLVHTPNRAGIQDVVELLGRPADEMLKCMLYDVGGTPTAVLVPGDREINESKLARVLAPAPVRMFTDNDFAAYGLPKGYVGPQSLPEEVTIVADHSVRARSNWVSGAGQPDYHATGVNAARDFTVDRWEDVSRVREGDPCPRCGSPLQVSRAIEVGHCFQLGTRYSVAMKATFVDEDGTEQPYVMGSYGIGVSRIIAAVAEQWNDDAGLKWPKVLAPFDAVVIPTNMDHQAVVDAAERLYGSLRKRGVDVVIDDRDASAGVKFADADLIGYPLQVVIGKRGIESGNVDLKARATGERTQAPLDAAPEAAIGILESVP
ncbi:MAG TPA: proline--tRNA ligase [Actinomycetota bacterium]|nr:proline--tRNA ligase [Actinomycetota bacterium]